VTCLRVEVDVGHRSEVFAGGIQDSFAVQAVVLAGQGGDGVVGVDDDFSTRDGDGVDAEGRDARPQQGVAVIGFFNLSATTVWDCGSSTKSATCPTVWAVLVLTTVRPVASENSINVVLPVAGGRRLPQRRTRPSRAQ
jgi:hypothetical protein